MMKLRELLAFDDIAIQCHDHPDADTIASGFAVYKYLVKNGKKPLLFYSGRTKIQKPNMKIMIENLGIPVKYSAAPTRGYELLVTVDCAYGESNVQHFPAAAVAVIDHHICRGTLPGLHEIRSDRGACASVVRQMLLDEGFDINTEPELATALYYGLYMDTNGFDEIRHPDDKDLRDLTEHDETLLMLLKNSNLTNEEMMIAGDALKNCKYLTEYGLAICWAEPCDPNILGFISDLIIQVNTVNCCVVFCRNAAGYKLSVRSCSTMTNAADLAKYISDGDGGGHAQKAGGFINSILVSDKDILSYMTERMISYHKDADVFDPAVSKPDMSGMKRYAKKNIVLGYIPSTDIVPEGEELLIRMLEADTIIRSAADVYIMIGVSGEVYPIDKEKFEKRYTPCSELPEKDYEYIPTVIDKVRRIGIPLTEKMKGCRASGDSSVLARRLTRYAKVFTQWTKNGFLYGRPGDYLAASSDDGSDVYIIRRSVFSKLYIADKA